MALVQWVRLARSPMLRRSLPLLLLIGLALPAGAAAAPYRLAPAPSSAPSLTPKQTLHKAQAVLSGHGAGDGFELTPLLKDLAVKLPALHGGDRAHAKRLLDRPTAGSGASGESEYTVPEHDPPFCSARFCIHWVDTTADAPSLAGATAANGFVPDYVRMVDAVFEHVYDIENGQLQWRPPTSDGANGCPHSAPDCMNKTDVYIKNIGDQGIYGYSAPDPLQTTSSQAAYLVMDNDYAEPAFRKNYPDGPLRPMEVTAAHEYNHVLQFGYDVAQDTWMFESTAVWMEDKVYTEVNDYLQYLGPWARRDFVPLTQFLPATDSQPNPPDNVKVYGDMVWNRWIDGRFGQETVRSAWEHSLSTKPKSFAPGAYNEALTAHGSSFFDSFSKFAADTAEWRAADSAFAEGSTFPADVQRGRSKSGAEVTLTPGGKGVGTTLSHTAYTLVNVAPLSVPRLKLVVKTDAHKQMAVALVGRIGGDQTGTTVVALQRLPDGGRGAVVLPDTGRFARITAVLINADGRTTGDFSRTLQDWGWVGDGASVAAHLSTDFSPPSIRARTPRPGANAVSPRTRVSIAFSEPLSDLQPRTVLLVGPGNHRVKARVRSSSKGRKLAIVPARPLRPRTRYTVRLTSAITDGGGNPLGARARTWTFRTGR